MDIAFLDPSAWDYRASAADERPLPGPQSALCYLAVELVRRGHAVTLFTRTTRPGVAHGVRCLSSQGLPPDLLRQPWDAFVVLNGPGDVGLQLRPHLHAATPLVLWSHYPADQPAMQSLRQPAARDAWDVVVCGSEGQRTTLVAHCALEPARAPALRDAIAPAFEKLFSSPDELLAAKASPPRLAYTGPPAQGLGGLLEVFPEIHRELPEVELRVYAGLTGEQPPAHEDVALSERCRATPGVRYVGSLPPAQLAEELKASLLAYPNAAAETNSTAVLEALAAGAFVLSSTRSREELKEVLAWRGQNPPAFAAERFVQVLAVNAQHTWGVRAREWEAAIPGWKRAAGRGPSPPPARPASPAARPPTPASAEEPWLDVYASRNFPDWLAEQRVSLALTTYQTAKLILIGVNAERRLSVFERTFNRCMGLWADGQTLWLSSQYQLWRFENVLNPGQLHQGHDRLYVPRVGYTTGDLDVHDVAVESTGRVVFVNTRFGCLATVGERDSFTPLWRPPFLSKLAAEDRCHLNGLALDGRARYVTAVSGSDVADGWRERRRDGGLVLDVRANRVVASGLSMPHSPRLYRGRLWLLNSGTGEFGSLDPAGGAFVPLAFCPGYARGLAFVDHYAVLGLSRPRHDKTFGGLPLDEALAAKGAEPRCGLHVIDLNSGDTAHWLRLEGMVSELYDVAVLPGVVRPMALGFKTDEIQRLLTVGEEGAL